jgi:mannitol-specific phosphotransferase system IIBC component
LEVTVNFYRLHRLKFLKIAHHAFREVAFLKNRASYYFVFGLISLAAIGVVGRLIANPSGFLTRIAIVAIISAAIYFVVKRFYLTKPEKRENRAFAKAAKQSKKRLQQKEPTQTSRRSSGTVTSLKKNTKAKKSPSAHLTVIEGKKGKKKNRASF